MDRVFEKLQELEIHPSEMIDIHAQDDGFQDSELLKQIRGEAEAIRRKWNEDDPSLGIVNQEVCVDVSFELPPEPEYTAT